MSIEDSPLLDQVFEQVLNLHNEIARYEQTMQDVFDDLHPQHRDSARNLLHYLAFRCHDVRDIQGKLSSLGLSSLGRSEAYILTALQQVLNVLSRLTPKTLLATAAAPPLASWEEGKAILDRNTVALFVPTRPGDTFTSWSRCQRKRPTATNMSARWFKTAWTACGLTARTTMSAREKK